MYVGSENNLNIHLNIFIHCFKKNFKLNFQTKNPVIKF